MRWKGATEPATPAELASRAEWFKSEGSWESDRYRHDWRKSRYVEGWKEPAYNKDWQDRGAEGSMWTDTMEPTCRRG